MASPLDSLLGNNARQAGIVIVGVVVTALVFGISHWATRPQMVPLYTGLAIESVGPLTDKLSEAGISYELDPA